MTSASMEEVVYRRQATPDEEQPLPQLIIIDGEKAARKAFFVKAPKKLTCTRRSPWHCQAPGEIYSRCCPQQAGKVHQQETAKRRKVIQQARNEAHRFAITFHRKSNAASPS